MTSPTVSILIPAYNVEYWIEEAILSALNQTWPKKEVIIVDDGSHDNTLKIARQFEGKAVKVIKQENQGASAARNTALRFAQGDYIQWLDADDLLDPEKISQQLREVDHSRDTRILLSSAFGKFYYQLEKAQFVPTALWQDLPPIEWFLTKFTQNVWMNPAVWLVSRRLTDLSGPWNEQLSLDDDGEYFCRVVAHSERVKFVSKARSYYRQWNASSLSRTLSDKAYDSLRLSLILCINHLKSLEESERSRISSIKFLQDRLIYFYPDRYEIINDIAKSLGGNLHSPCLKWKYHFIQKVFGWHAAKKR